jgi:DNA-binding transcriptional ArsR family regulator
MVKRQTNSPKVSADVKLRNKSPHLRDQFANNMIVEFLERSPNGVTIKQIIEKTELARPTIVRHLERLVALRYARKRDFGYVSLYYKGGYPEEETSESEKFSDDTSFTFQIVNRGADGNFIYVQEKQLNDFREEKVIGGIMVNTKDAHKFAKMFHTYALKVGDIEPRK